MILFPLTRICGLRPDLWLSVGSGYNREDVKSLILSQGLGFVGDAVTTLQDICLKITGLEQKRILGSFSRQEVLRILLAEPEILVRLPEINQMKRQRNFLGRLDHALQQGRMAFAHVEEEAVYEERLNQALGKNPLRSEISGLSTAYDAWLRQSQYVDACLLIRQATQVLQQGWPERLAKPKEVWCLNVQLLESLEREFWDVFSQWVQVKQIEILEHTKADSIAKNPTVNWQRWHTLDDAAEFLAEKLSTSSDLENLKDHAILIPDIPGIRRSLKRALESWDIPLADPRDPTQLKWEEPVKWALLPLELVARNFERDRVISWLRTWMEKGSVSDHLLDFVKEINSRGIRHGLFFYQGGVLDEVFKRLSELNIIFSGKRTALDFSELHLGYLKSQIHFKSEYFWLIEFFEGLWKELNEDLDRTGQNRRKAHLLFWLEKLQSRLNEATPPVKRVKPRYGVQIFRLQQAPLFPAQHIWVFGLPASWLDGQGSGGYWFTEREREVLGGEFAVRSKVQIREERLKVLKAWFSGAENIVLLDAFYDSQGKEKETIQPILQELELLLNRPFPGEPEEKGAHTRFLRSYDAARPVPPQEVKLPKLFSVLGNRLELSATVIDRYSRCPFQSLAYHRWNLSDLRDPDTELWPDVKGNLIHETLRILMSSLGSDQTFTFTPQEAINKVWSLKRPRGLIKSKRVENYVKTRTCLVVQSFCDREIIYLQQSNTFPISLDQTIFRLEYQDLTIVGKPDRVDQHSDGLFIMDYKTSGSVPHGEEILEQGYRLQLPFYAAAVRKELNQPVLGVQFVELDRKGSRKSGIFFKKYNGKDPGCLTSVRASSKSLFDVDPDEVWSRLEKELLRDAHGYLDGIYPARPKIEKRDKECNRCSLSDLCGMKRLASGQAADGC